MVLDGKGNELLNIKSRNPEVQEFITNIPAYMAKIASIHAAAGRFVEDFIPIMMPPLLFHHL